jgi:cellulose synthase/poly-beta-1,6-N-acetylglucosamine synthase-like glycosyltransferase
MDTLEQLSREVLTLRQMLASTGDDNWLDLIGRFFPFVLLFEMPVYLTVMLGALRHYLNNLSEARRPAPPFHPPVTCIITCYAEGADVQKTVVSLTEQLYPGHIEMLAVVDGAHQNRATAQALRALLPYVAGRRRRKLIIVPKLQRGGRVSSLNQGLALASGQIVCALDGDTSFDNDMVLHIARHFADQNVVAVSGNLRVRNAASSLTTRLQALEYMLSIHLSRTGLDEYRAINNISGAFGAFRRDFLRRIGGWDSGTAEDLDLTLRIKKYFARHPHLRIRFEPRAIGHTDAPEHFHQFLKQRLRWDGDLSYLYLRKFRESLRPALLGWRNFLALAWTGLFFQIVLPFVVIGYMGWMVVVHPIAEVLGVFALVYLFYVLLTAVMYVQYMLLLSERRAHDARFAWLVLLFPAFAFATRLWNGIATLSEMLTKSHLDSSMAPWWVLRKTRF